MLQVTRALVLLVARICGTHDRSAAVAAEAVQR
jgi:hypothetical protein